MNHPTFRMMTERTKFVADERRSETYIPISVSLMCKLLFIIMQLYDIITDCIHQGKALVVSAACFSSAHGGLCSACWSAASTAKPPLWMREPAVLTSARTYPCLRLVRWVVAQSRSPCHPLRRHAHHIRVRRRVISYAPLELSSFLPPQQRQQASSSRPERNSSACRSHRPMHMRHLLLHPRSYYYRLHHRLSPFFPLRMFVSIASPSPRIARDDEQTPPSV